MDAESIRLKSIPLAVAVVLSTAWGCAGGPGTGGESETAGRVTESGEMPEGVRDVLSAWEEAVGDEDREALKALYQPQAKCEYRDGRGNRYMLNGSDAIVEFRLGPALSHLPGTKYRLPDSLDAGEVREDNSRMGIKIRYGDSGLFEWLGFRRQGDEWTIYHSDFILPQPGPYVTNRFQAVGDENSDGFIEGQEHHAMSLALPAVLGAPHPVSGPFDAVFDGNGDGRLDEAERDRALDAFFLTGPRMFLGIHPDWANKDLDLDGDGAVADEELESLRVFMSAVGRPGEERAFGSEMMRNYVDKNGNGFVDDAEIETAERHFIGLAVNMPFSDALYMNVPRKVATATDVVADGNGDGTIDAAEQRAAIDTLSSHHRTSGGFDRIIDENRDNHIDSFDIQAFMRDSAMNRGIGSSGAEPPYAVRTPVDGLLDRERDGRIDAQDIETAVLAFAGRVDLFEAFPMLKVAVDRNTDGSIDVREVDWALASLVLPHPVASADPLDARNDVNRDGFVDPEELGVSAGSTDRGWTTPFDSRIALVRLRTADRDEAGPQSDMQAGTKTAAAPHPAIFVKRDPGWLRNRKLAVAGLDVGTERVDPEISRGLAVFIENAFVNIEGLTVVDRSHFEEIFQELEFQSSGLADEKTTVEIGKMTGADIIVAGSLYNVGDVFYLNIKLIEVETAEIAGSSIAEGKSPGDFLEMASRAVVKLF